MPIDRSPLAPLYQASAVMAGVALVAIAVLMIGETLLRKFLGGYIPGASQLIAWSCCAAAFLAMPYAFRRGDFVRVDLAAAWLPLPGRRAAEVLSLLLMLGFCGFAAVATARYAWAAARDEEMTQGMLELPLWWPQLSMVLGLALLALAVAECLLDVLRGRTAIYALHDQERRAKLDFSDRI